MRFADSKNASAAGNRESKAFRRKYRRRLFLPSPARQCHRASQTFHVKPRCIATAFQKNPFRTTTARICANKPATQTGLRKNRRNTSLFIKLSGSYKTFLIKLSGRTLLACLLHVKRFQTGHSARKVLFGRGAVARNAQTTPAFHVKRFQTTGRSVQDALFGRVAVGCGSQAPCVSRETLCRAETTRRHTEMPDVAAFPSRLAPPSSPEYSHGELFHVKRCRSECRFSARTLTR